MELIGGRGSFSPVTVCRSWSAHPLHARRVPVGSFQPNVAPVSQSSFSPDTIPRRASRPAVRISSPTQEFAAEGVMV